MKKIEAAMSAADPLPQAALQALPLAAGETALVRGILAEPGASGAAAARGGAAESARAPRAARVRPRLRLPGVAVGLAGLAAIALAVVVIGLGGDRAPQPAAIVPGQGQGQGLVRLAKTSPLVLLDQPGWRVVSAKVGRHGHGSLRFRGNTAAGAETAELRWHPGHLSGPGAASGWRVARISVEQGVDAPVTIYGYVGHRPRRISATWEDGGRVLEFSSVTARAADFEKRLDSLRRVGPSAWLKALPADQSGGR
jgi:hypothetical protein